MIQDETLRRKVGQSDSLRFLSGTSVTSDIFGFSPRQLQENYLKKKTSQTRSSYVLPLFFQLNTSWTTLSEKLKSRPNAIRKSTTWSIRRVADSIQLELIFRHNIQHCNRATISSQQRKRANMIFAMMFHLVKSKPKIFPKAMAEEPAKSI